MANRAAYSDRTSGSPGPYSRGHSPTGTADGFLCMQPGVGVGPLSGGGCQQNALKAGPLNLINIPIVFPNLEAADGVVPQIK